MIRHTFETDRFPAEARETVLAFFEEHFRLKKLAQTEDTLSFKTACPVPFMRHSGLPQVRMRFEETVAGTRIHSVFSLDLADRIAVIVFSAFAILIEVVMLGMLFTQGLSSCWLLLVPVGWIALVLFLSYGILFLCVRRLIRKLNQEL